MAPPTLVHQRCCPILEVHMRASGPHTDCTWTTVESQHVIVTEEMVILRGPYQLFSLLHTNRQTWYLDKSDLHDMHATTPYELDWTIVVSWSLQWIWTDFTNVCRHSRTVEPRVGKRPAFPLWKTEEDWNWSTWSTTTLIDFTTDTLILAFPRPNRRFKLDTNLINKKTRCI